MANKTPVHVLPRGDGWGVVREGGERATSVHRTQAEAARAGREIARGDGTAFLLHARDGRVRDRSYYGDDEPGPPGAEGGGPSSGGSESAGLAAAATGAVGNVVGGASGLVGETVGGLGRSDDSAGNETDPETEETEANGLNEEERYAGYVVYDRGGEDLGGLDALLLDEKDEIEYVGVKAGPRGDGSALVPVRAARIDEERRAIVVAADKAHVQNGPTFVDDREITPEFERRVRGHYGLAGSGGTGDRDTPHGDRYPGAGSTHAAGAPAPRSGTTAGGEDRLRDRAGEGGEEIRVQRSEEELVAGTREREAGAVRIRKRVRTERERVEVPVARETVHVERVPVSGGTPGAEIGEEEIVVPVTETEVVVSKRPVIKEEVRVRKDAVEETEVVEEDVRREEVDVEDATERGRGTGV